MEYCGIDAHSKSSTLCVVDSQGNKLMLEKTPSTKIGLGEKIGRWDVGMPIIIEACSSSRPVLRYLREIGFDNITVVNPMATAQMRARGKKTDVVDAQGLAELARLGLTDAWKVHIPGEWAQRMRDLLYERELVVKHRVAIMNRVKSLFRREGKTAPALKGEESWSKLLETLPEHSRELEFLRNTRDNYLKQELMLTKMIKDELKANPKYELVRTVPCVGPLTAAVLLAFIDDVSRFNSARACASYFGVIPSIYQTGSTERTGSITKHGNSLARKFLAQAAHHAQYASSPFNPVYREIAGKKGAPRAIMAVAHKIVLSVYAVLKHDEPFDPVKMGLTKIDKEITFVQAYKKSDKPGRA
jgi:transposase